MHKHSVIYVKIFLERGGLLILLWSFQAIQFFLKSYVNLVIFPLMALDGMLLSSKL